MRKNILKIHCTNTDVTMKHLYINPAIIIVKFIPRVSGVRRINLWGGIIYFYFE